LTIAPALHEHYLVSSHSDPNLVKEYIPNQTLGSMDGFINRYATYSFSCNSYQNLVTEEPLQN